jgi:hypothetical protein
MSINTLDTRSVGAAFRTAGLSEGVTLYEPCGGMCSGLEGLLANGIHVKRYLYSDIDPKVQATAHHRLAFLSNKYGNSRGFPSLPSAMPSPPCPWMCTKWTAQL